MDEVSPTIRPEAAVRRAREALAWTGQADAAWSVVLEARLAAPLDRDRVAARLAAAAAATPRLGPPPPVDAVAEDDLPRVRSAFADAPYLDGGPAVRAAVAGGDRAVVVLAAHHGALDGLGLVALLGEALGAPVTSSVRGVEAAPVEGWRPGAVASRLREALFTPPSRVRPARRDPSPPGDRLVAVTGSTLRGGTAALVAAAVRGVGAWNAGRNATTHRPVVAVGVSRRSGADPTLAHEATWLRLRLGDARDEAAVAEALRRTAPERVGRGPVLPSPVAAGIRFVAEQLGSTLLVSNLGVLTGPPDLRSVAFFPKQYGRSPVALGATTVGDTTTLALRVPARGFGDDDAERLVGGIAGALHADAPGAARRSAAELPTA